MQSPYYKLLRGLVKHGIYLPVAELSFAHSLEDGCWLLMSRSSLTSSQAGRPCGSRVEPRMDAPPKTHPSR